MSKPLTNTHQSVEVSIETTDSVYPPGEISLVLCDLMRIPQDSVVADVGCGTGYLGIVTSLLGAKKVYCIDPLVEAIELTKRNARANGITNIEAIVGNELSPILDDSCEVILTNPPQTPFPTELEQMRYGGEFGTDVIEKIIEQASTVLAAEGHMYLSHVSHASPQRVYQYLKAANMKYDIVHSIKKRLDADDYIGVDSEVFDYIVALSKQGVAELVEENGALYYYHRLYEIRRW